MDHQPNETVPSEHQLWPPKVISQRPSLCVEIGLGTFTTPMFFNSLKDTSLSQVRVIGFEPDPDALIYEDPTLLQTYMDWLRVAPHPIKDYGLVATDLAGQVDRVWMHNVLSAPGVSNDFETQILDPAIKILAENGEIIVLDGLARGSQIKDKLYQYCTQHGLTCTPIDMESDQDPYLGIYKRLDKNINDERYIAVRITRRSANG